ncbi:MAG: hypothetical protein ACRCUY_07285 [Thermoguttaceae bacterium]
MRYSFIYFFVLILLGNLIISFVTGAEDGVSVPASVQPVLAPPLSIPHDESTEPDSLKEIDSSPKKAETDSVNLPSSPQQSTSSTPSNSTSTSTNSSPASSSAVSILSARQNSWAGFLPNSWVLMQSVTSIPKDSKRLVNVTETRTTLDRVEPNQYEITQQTTAEIGGKQVEMAAQKKILDFFSEPNGEGVKISSGNLTTLQIGLNVISCGVRVYEQTTASEHRKTTIWYSTQLYPFIFRIERVIKTVPTDSEPEPKIISQSITEVRDSAALSPQTASFGTYMLRTIKKSGAITTVSDTLGSLFIPGGILEDTTRELDQSGQEIRSIQTRALNYFVQPPADSETPNLLFPPNFAPFQQEPYLPIRPRSRRPY